MSTQQRMTKEKYYVQSSQVRGEPRFYWIIDRTTRKCVTEWSQNGKQVELRCKKLNAHHKKLNASSSKE